MTGKYPTVVMITGPTAIGKTSLAIELAQILDGEVIGADSRQIFKEMDIGTAKPTPEQQAKIPHHLIDIAYPDEHISLAEYQKQAYGMIDDVLHRGKFPFVVGGTGQYITALEEGWSIPQVPPNDELRNELEAEAVAIGNMAFHEKLSKIDPQAAEKIHPNNVRRVVRAMEVYLETGTPISILQQKKAPPYRILVVGLKMEREALYQRADERVLLMIHDGFVAEVERLLDMGYAPELPSMSALGYREIAQHIQGKLTLDEAIAQTQYSTHNFIRRQEIWFRGHDNGILWHNGKQVDYRQVLDEILAWSEMC